MMMKHLSQTPPNMSSIGAVCNSLGKTFLMLLVDNLGATGGLWVNLSPVKVKLIIFPLFLPEGNAILPMTAKTVCSIHIQFMPYSMSAWVCFRHSTVITAGLVAVALLRILYFMAEAQPGLPQVRTALGQDCPRTGHLLDGWEFITSRDLPEEGEAGQRVALGGLSS